MTKQWKPGEQVPESTTYVAYDEEGNNGGSLYLEKVNASLQHSTQAVTMLWKMKTNILIIKAPIRVFF